MKNVLLTATFILLIFSGVSAQENGSLDATFANGGMSVINDQQLDLFQDVIIQDDQKILGIGFSFNDIYTATVYVMRFLPDGTLDEDFGVNGTFTYSLDNEALAYRGVINSEGKIILAGSTTDYVDYRIMLIQLNSDGTLDDSFGDNGVVTTSVGIAEQYQTDQAYGLALDADENILVSGVSKDENSLSRPVVLRFSPDGVLDTTFGESGVATIPVEYAENTFDCVQVQSDGKIVAAGHYAKSELWFVLLMARYNVDGTLDTTFGDEGTVKYSYTDVDDEAYDMAIAPDDKIVVSGFSGSQDYTYNTLLMRFTADGIPDETFGDNGLVAEDNGTYDVADKVDILEDGRIVIGGTSGESPPNNSNMAAWMYNSDGSPDTNFGVDGFATHVVSGNSVLMHGMAIQADGKIVLAGQARPGDGTNNFIIARMLNTLTTGISEKESALAPQIYPNPAVANEVITIDLASSMSDYTGISFYSLDGRLIYTKPLNQFKGSNQITTTIPARLSQGIYLVRLEGNGIYSATSKLILTQ